MSSVVSNIWPEVITEQSLNREEQVLPKYFQRLWLTNKRTQANFVLNAVCYGCSLNTSIRKNTSYHVLNLGRKHIHSSSKFMIVPGKQTLGEVKFPAFRHYGTSLCNSKKVNLSHSVLQIHHLKCRQYRPINRESHLEAEVFNHLGFDNSSIGFGFFTFPQIDSWTRADSMAFSTCHCKRQYRLQWKLSNLPDCIFSKLLNVPASQIYKPINCIDKFSSLHFLSCVANNLSNIY